MEIKILVNGKEMKLDDAKELWSELNKIFGNKDESYQPAPWYPNYPWYPNNTPWYPNNTPWYPNNTPWTVYGLDEYIITN